MSEMKDKVVNKAVVKAADKVNKIDNTWNRTIAGGLAGASIGLLTSPKIGKKIKGTFLSAKTKVKEKDLGESAKQMKDRTLNMVQDKFKKDKSSDEDNHMEKQDKQNENAANQNDKNNDENQNDNSQDNQKDQSSQEHSNQDTHMDQSNQDNQANENLRHENENLKQKIEELEDKLNKLLNEKDNSLKEEVAANSNGISIVRQDDVTK
ncbi:hypothetical protein [Terribacillus saccharophilus]|uniref:hypothetical protein n=1 Tax=Terribacillus saccharophilus TaxID=361277 RepID=UPI003982AF4C